METLTKRDVARLVIQKILSSDAIEFLSKASYTDLNAMFLTENIEDRPISANFRRKEDNSYYGTIADVHMEWKDEEGEFQDDSGNVWKVTHLHMKCGISSQYGIDQEGFALRARCISLVDDMIASLGTYTQKFRYLAFNNEQRIARDAHNKSEYQKRYIVARLKEDGGVLCKNLRTNGSPRAIAREKFDTIPAGEYKVKVYRSKHSDAYKEYTLDIYSESARYAYLKRTK